MKGNILFTGLATSAVALGLAVSNIQNDDKALSSKLLVDDSAPDRSGPFGGYSAIVEEVSPSIVSIFTTRNGGGVAANRPDLERFFNHPQFRRYFGPGQRRMQPVPQPKQQGLGSGVILTTDGFILTNNHVVQNADEIRVQLSNGKNHDASIIATDPASDLAVIKVDEKKLPAATVGNSDQLKQGDLVLAIGSPFGLDATVTSGIVSAIGRDNLNIAGYENFIQTDASINPGNSGGALIDNKGRVVGINTAILSRSGGNVGIGFAIPINMAVNIAEQLIDNGEMKRGYLGVTLGALTDELSEALGVKVGGVVVNEVMPGTAAEEAGLQAGDVITSIDGNEIEDIADVRRFVSRTGPGATIAVGLHRDGEDLSIDVTLGELTPELLAGTNAERPSQSAPVPDDGALSGVRLGRIDDALREQLGLEDGRNGVVVLEVDPKSKAAQAGLKPGQVITEVNQQPVSSPREAYTQASDRKDRATLLRVLEGKSKRFLAIG